MVQCRFCLFNNPEDEERCSRCGKRISGAPTLDGISLAGATALAPRRRAPTIELAPEFDGAPAPARKSKRAAVAVAAGQASLFGSDLDSNVIAFESIPRASAGLRTEVIRTLEPGPAASKLAAAKQQIKKHGSGPSLVDVQSSLGLESLQPLPQAPRLLETTVEASIYCDAPVASPVLRAIAGALDTAMILIACGFFMGIFQLGVGNIQLDRPSLALFLGSLAIIAMFYGLLFALANRETPGQRWTQLRLINFDGFPPDGQARALRLVGFWVGLCALGMGVLWALIDEESLSWHDHMSKTFVTPLEPDSTLTRVRIDTQH